MRHVEISSAAFIAMIRLSSYHRIIGWKRPLRSSSPTICPTPPCLLNNIPKSHIYTFF